MTIVKWSAAAVAILVAYLLLWPTGLDPVAWTPPPAPPPEGVYAYNEKLKGIQRLAPGVGVGPAGVHVDEFGRIVAGYADGRVVLIYDQGASYMELDNTGGRPLGIAPGPQGGVVIADASKGLLYLRRSIRPLADEVDGLPLRYASGVDFSRPDERQVYFTDASSKFGYNRQVNELLEHGAHGRLLQYDVVSEQTRVLMRGLHFANGVALGPDADYVLVNETAEYRTLRYWLKGDKAGTHDVFIDNLPGFSGNLSFNGRDRFWIALYAPRDLRLDALLPAAPYLKNVVARLPPVLRPGPRKHAFVLGLDLEGKVVANLQYAGQDAYAAITSVQESGPWLYFGSASDRAVGRIPLAQVVPGSVPPPPGWEQVPAATQKPNPLSAQERNEDE